MGRLKLGVWPQDRICRLQPILLLPTTSLAPIPTPPILIGGQRRGGKLRHTPAAQTKAGYFLPSSSEPPPNAPATFPSSRVNSIGKMNFEDGLEPMFRNVSRY